MPQKAKPSEAQKRGCGSFPRPLAGGICCHTWSATIANCCNYGQIVGGDVGGILGYQNGSTDDGDGYIVNCWSLGTLKNDSGNANSIGYITHGVFYGYVDSCYGVNVGALKAVSNVSGGELRMVKAFTAAQMQELCDSLNAWVNAQNQSDGQYATWTIPSGAIYPIPIG